MVKGCQYNNAVYACACYASITEMNSKDRLFTSIVDKNDRSMFQSQTNSTAQYRLRIGTLCSTRTHICMHMCMNVCTLYRIGGNFRGVLIFAIFVVDSAVTKIITHEN